MNRHVFYDKKSIAGQAVVELGRAETYLIRCSRAQAGKSFEMVEYWRQIDQLVDRSVGRAPD